MKEYEFKQAQKQSDPLVVAAAHPALHALLAVTGLKGVYIYNVKYITK